MANFIFFSFPKTLGESSCKLRLTLHVERRCLRLVDWLSIFFLPQLSRPFKEWEFFPPGQKYRESLCLRLEWIPWPPILLCIFRSRHSVWTLFYIPTLILWCVSLLVIPQESMSRFVWEHVFLVSLLLSNSSPAQLVWNFWVHRGYQWPPSMLYVN